MAIIKEKGIVLNKIDTGEGNLRLVLLTENRGKLVVFANGAKKMTSRFNLNASGFSYVEFIIFDGGGFLSLNNIHLLHSFNNIHLNYDKYLSACLFLEICDKMLFQNMDTSHILPIVLYSLYFLDKDIQENKVVQAVFIFKFLQKEGIAPNISCCTLCKKNINANTYFFAEGVACNFCKKTHKLYFMPILQGSLDAIRYILQAQAKNMFNFNISSDIVKELNVASLLFLRENTDIEFNTLKLR